MTRLFMIALWATVLVLANRRDNHFMIGWSAYGLLYNVQEIGREESEVMKLLYTKTDRHYTDRRFTPLGGLLLGLLFSLPFWAFVVYEWHKGILK